MSVLGPLFCSRGKPAIFGLLSSNACAWSQWNFPKEISAPENGCFSSIPTTSDFHLLWAMSFLREMHLPCSMLIRGMEQYIWTSFAEPVHAEDDILWRMGWNPLWEEVLQRRSTNTFPSNWLNYFRTPNFLVRMPFKQFGLVFFYSCAVRMIIRKGFISLFNSFVCFVIRMFLPLGGIIALLLWDLEACRMLLFSFGVPLSLHGK